MGKRILPRDKEQILTQCRFCLQCQCPKPCDECQYEIDNCDYLHQDTQEEAQIQTQHHIPHIDPEQSIHYLHIITIILLLTKFVSSSHSEPIHIKTKSSPHIKVEISDSVTITPKSYSSTTFCQTAGDPSQYFSYKSARLFVYLPHIQKHNQCIQILYTGTFSQISCSLPPHCGSAVYHSIIDKWFGTSVGLCYGVGNSPISIKVNNKIHFKSSADWAAVYTPSFRKYSNDYPFPFNYSESFSLLHQTSPTGHSTYRLMPNFIIYSQLLLTDQGEYILPGLYKTNDSRYCSMKYSSSPNAIIDYPHAHTALHAVCQSNLPVYCLQPYSCLTPPSVPKRVISPSYTFSYNGQNLELSDLHLPTIVDCDPYAQTTNILPFSLSTITHTIAHAFINILLTLKVILWDVLIDTQRFYLYINTYLRINEFMLITSFFLLLKYEIKSSLCISLLITTTFIGLTRINQ